MSRLITYDTNHNKMVFNIASFNTAKVIAGRDAGSSQWGSCSVPGQSYGWNCGNPTIMYGTCHAYMKQYEPVPMGLDDGNVGGFTIAELLQRGYAQAGVAKVFYLDKDLNDYISIYFGSSAVNAYGTTVYQDIQIYVHIGNDTITYLSRGNGNIYNAGLVEFTYDDVTGFFPFEVGERQDGERLRTAAGWITNGFQDLKTYAGQLREYSGDYNPYEPGGETEEGGGDPNRQNWDDHSDAIVPDGLPTKGAINSGMLTVFSPTAIQVHNLVDLMFSYNFFDWLQKNLQNLEELFVSFGVVPFTVTTGATKSITFLGFDISSFTHPVDLTEAAEQYYEFDMGSIALDGSDPRIHASDSVFDYSPFSKLGIYLPFIGFQELNIDECRGATINLVYRVDIVSGSCVALIYLNSDKDRCIYQFSGNCLSQIPLGSVDMSGVISGSIAIATAAASAGINGAVASAGDAVGAEQVNKGKMTEAQENLGNHQRGAMVANGIGGLAAATVNSIMGMKPDYKHSGAIGSTGGLLAVKQPYIFLTTPREAIPANYQKYCGLPSNLVGTLGTFSGYTVVEDIRLNGLVATSSEVEEIYNLLKSGVII